MLPRGLSFQYVGLALALSLSATARAGDKPTPEGVEFFEKKVRPLLVKHCYECHGPDEQKGGLDLTKPEGAVKVLESGASAIVAGHPEESEALSRLLTKDEDARRWGGWGWPGDLPFLINRGLMPPTPHQELS